MSGLRLRWWRQWSSPGRWHLRGGKRGGDEATLCGRWADPFFGEGLSRSTMPEPDSVCAECRRKLESTIGALIQEGLPR